jgi:hypothetical protein
MQWDLCGCWQISKETEERLEEHDHWWEVGGMTVLTRGRFFGATAGTLGCFLLCALVVVPLVCTIVLSINVKLELSIDIMLELWIML